MILFLKHAVITIAGLVGFLAAIVAPVAWISQGMSDNPNDDSGRMLSISAFCVLVACGLLILLLSGCSDLRTVVHACRDGLCR